MAITVYVGDNNNTARKRQKSYVGYNNKAVEIFSEPPKIYGVVWGGSANTAWTRTDNAKNFSNPNPYYAGMSGTPSSPFDDIMPWAGMIRSTDANAGEVVAIPKFYYKLGYAFSKTGLKIQIAPASNGADWAAENGFKVSPAHMDRGDGAGERDTIYVGRYFCSATNYKSMTGVLPKNTITISTARSNISALGSKVWQYDYATLVTIWMLYLVEFANWNSQVKIGYGCTPPTASSPQPGNVGYTDTMPYHTGTTATARTSYGGTQYRYIEGLWDNEMTFIDGIRFNAANTYITLNPSNFSETSGGTLVGSRYTGSNVFSSAFLIPSVSDYEWAILVSDASGSDSTYVCDAYFYVASNVGLRQGGNASNNQYRGLFYLDDCSPSTSHFGTGCRLMILP